MKSKKIKLADNLKILIENRSLGLSGLAKSVGLNKSSLHNYINGVTPQGVVALVKLASFFGMTTDEILFGEDGATSERSKNILNVDSLGEIKFEITIKREPLRGDDSSRTENGGALPVGKKGTI